MTQHQSIPLASLRISPNNPRKTGGTDVADLMTSIEAEGLLNNLVVSADAGGNIHGLQFLRTAAQAREGKRPEKEFWPEGLAKKGHFHLIGHQPHWIVLIAEGYATAASLHAATGYALKNAPATAKPKPAAKAKPAKKAAKKTASKSTRKPTPKKAAK